MDVFERTQVCCIFVHANSSSSIFTPCFDRERANGLSSFECPLISLDRSYPGDSITIQGDQKNHLVSRLCLHLQSVLHRTVSHTITCCTIAFDCHMWEMRQSRGAVHFSASYCTFSAHADKCLAARGARECTRVHVCSQTRGSESEWRTSFKNYSWIMAQLTFSFCSNQRLSCTSSPVFSCDRINFFLLLLFQPYFLSPFQSKTDGEAWPFAPRWLLQQRKTARL